MPDPDQIERVFLGNDGPPIGLAADWLLHTLGGEGGVLGEALVVVPGARGLRRLTELLAERSAGRALLPPTVVTLGGLADRLMPTDAGPIAGGLDTVLAWASALREAEAGLLRQVLPDPPARDDWPGWWALADQVASAADELGAQLLAVRGVAEHAPAEHRDAARWAALGELAGRYEQALAERGLVDRHAARLQAIEARACDWPGPVVLVGVADLQAVHEKMLSCVASPVTALVAAGAGDAGGFDRYGGLVVSYWAERAIAIDDGLLSFVDRPGDQAAAVLRAVEGWSGGDGLEPDAVTVGLGDESLGGPIARTLDLAGVPVRAARGRAVVGSRPVQLLRALSEFAEGLRFDGLALLLRHPDAEQAIAADTGESTRPWLTLLDRYAADHLAVRPTGGWLGDRDRVQALDKVFQSAKGLLPDPPGATRPLGEWAEPIGDALARVYGRRRLSRHAEEDRPVVAALDAIGEQLERFGAVDAQAQPRCTFSQAITLLISQLGHAVVPDPGGEAAVELVGYLELLLDDAPHLVIAGLNEQHVPAPPTHSPLLTEGLRAALGLAGDERRLARDGYALAAMLAWRDGVRLIAGKRSADNDPLLPSRLLLKTDDDTLARRVARFVEEQHAAPPAPALLEPGRDDRFLIPRPVLPIEPINKLRVTAFRDYLACPYRFYLKHVLGLETADDTARELTPGGFGTLAHRTLRTLASDEVRGLDDPDAIRQRLGSALDRLFAETYGRHAPVAAQIQAEQLRYRLDGFAHTQAELVREGWRIVHAEEAFEQRIEVDGQAFTITGTIDRIDHHPERGYRLIDYKTANSAIRPDKAHRKKVDGVPTWVDLQLPLYIGLSEKVHRGAAVETGYIQLPKKPEDIGYSGADWSEDDLAEANAQRDAVIRAVRERVFWPPTRDHRNAYDGLAGLCGDEVADRAALIARSEPPGGEAGR